MRLMRFYYNKLFLTLGLLTFAITHTATAQGFNSKGLFQSIEFKVDSVNTLPKWKNVLSKIKKEEKDLKKCDENLQSCKTKALSTWRSFILESKFKTQKEILQDVNSFINKWPYIQDVQNWEKTDYWASPVEFLDKSGDCEDYAIIKYVTLKDIGFNPEKMRIVVVMDKLRLMNHAVLVVYDNNNEPFVLDSLFDTVLPHHKVLQYTPHYSVNEFARWAHVMPIINHGRDKGKENE